MKHDYPDLMDKAAPQASLAEISRLASKVSPLLLQTWVRYSLDSSPATERLFKISYHNERICAFQSAFSNEHAGNHSDFSGRDCSLWDSSRSIILAALGRAVDIDSNFSLIIATNSSTCCQKAANSWRNKVFTRFNAVKRFSAFLGSVNTPSTL